MEFLLLWVPLAGQCTPRSEGRISPGQCQVQQLAYFSFRSFSALPFGMNFSELLNIQKRDWPFLGPSLRNSWPSPLPHLPHVTFKAPGRSSRLATLSPCRVSVNAGHGDECSYLARLENSS